MNSLIDNYPNTNSNVLYPLSIIARSKGFRIASLTDVNSLLKHIDEIRVILEKNPLDVLAINESKIDDSISDNEIKIPGYALCRKDRNRNGGGGGGGGWCCISETAFHL